MIARYRYASCIAAALGVAPWLVGDLALADSATSGTAGQVVLAPGLCSNCGSYNTGTQTIGNGSTAAQQVYYVAVSSAGTQAVAGTDGGKFWTATVSGVTFSVFGAGGNGTTGVSFGWDGSHGYSITSSSQIYGCGPTGTTVAVNYSASLTSDGTNWQCTPNASLEVLTASKTANYTVLSTDNGIHFDNVGASGAVNYSLPSAAPHLGYCFTVDAAQTVTATAASGEKVYSSASPPVNGATAGNAHSNSPGSTICLESHKAGQWYTVSATGSWTFQ